MTRLRSAVAPDLICPRDVTTGNAVGSEQMAEADASCGSAE
jgi:hypothetical protein